MRITLVRPPFYSLVGVSGSSHPLALGYLSASLSEAGHQVAVVDGEVLPSPFRGAMQSYWSNLTALVAPYRNAHKHARMLDAIIHDHEHPVWNLVTSAILDTRPDIIGISCYTVSMTAVKIIVSKLRKERRDVKVILGGIHITSMPEQTLRDVAGLTALVVGEGEKTIVDLVNELSRKNPSLENVNGIAYLDSHGAYCKTAPRGLIPNIDDIPLPTREWPGYTYGSHLGMSSRGCPFSCSFCDSRSIWTRKVRMASQGKMMAEVDLIDKMGIRFFRYSDDTFTVDRKRTAEWCNNIRAGGYHKRMRFGFGTRVELITKECVEDYASAGVIDISFGIETGSKRIRALISKDFHGTDPYEAVKTVNDAKIGSRTYFMIGHPDERPDDVKETIALIRKMSELPMNYVEVNVMCPYPGTELWKLALEKTGGKPFVNIDSYYKMFHQATPVINLTGMNDSELELWIKELYRVSRLSALKNRSRMWGRQLFMNPIPTLKLIKERVFR